MECICNSSVEGFHGRAVRGRGGFETYLDMSLISARAASAAVLASSASATKGFAASRAFEARASPSAALDPSYV